MKNDRGVFYETSHPCDRRVTARYIIGSLHKRPGPGSEHRNNLSPGGDASHRNAYTHSDAYAHSDADSDAYAYSDARTYGDAYSDAYARTYDDGSTII